MTTTTNTRHAFKPIAGVEGCAEGLADADRCCGRPAGDPVHAATIAAGDLVEGRCVTMGHDVVGTVVEILYGTGHGYFTTDATHARPGMGRRYIVLPLDPEAREVIVECANPYRARPVAAGKTAQEIADDFGAGAPTPAKLRDLRDACRAPLALGESREVVAGNVRARVFPVAGGSFTRLDVRRGAELLLSHSGTFALETDALRRFAAIVSVIVRLGR